MKTFLLTVLLFFASTISVESFFLGGFGVGLLALKGAILGGLALGGALRRRSRYRSRSYHHHHYPKYYVKRRYGRSIEDLDGNSVLELPEDMLIQADLKDFDDCAKMLVCQVNTKSDTLDDMESLIQNIFGLNSDESLDVMKASARFDLAAMVGRKGGLKQCYAIYGRCQLPYEDLLKIMEENNTYAMDS